MQHKTALLGALVLLTLPALASAEEPSPAVTAPAPVLGGVGYFSPGVMVGRLKGPSDLETPERLGTGSGLSGTSLLLGGGGKALYGDLLLGGKGFGFDFGEFSNDNGDVSAFGGGGGVEIGYAFRRDVNHFAYASVGVGGVGLNMEVTNRRQTDMEFGGATIKPGQSASFEGGFVYADVTVGTWWMLPDAQGGFLLGFEVGGLFCLSAQPWQDANGDDLSGVTQAGWDGAFFRVHIGGGGFFLE